MKLLCDEDIGTGVPRALYAVAREARSMIDLGWRTYSDTQWLTLAGQGDWLIFSKNKRMLLAQDERDTIIREKLGIVFLTTGNDHPYDVLQGLLAKWETLDLLQETLERPFARFLSPNGRIASQFRQFKL